MVHVGMRKALFSSLLPYWLRDQSRLLFPISTHHLKHFLKDTLKLCFRDVFLQMSSNWKLLKRENLPLKRKVEKHSIRAESEKQILLFPSPNPHFYSQVRWWLTVSWASLRNFLCILPGNTCFIYIFFQHKGIKFYIVLYLLFRFLQNRF